MKVKGCRIADGDELEGFIIHAHNLFNAIIKFMVKEAIVGVGTLRTPGKRISVGGTGVVLDEKDSIGRSAFDLASPNLRSIIIHNNPQRFVGMETVCKAAASKTLQLALEES